MIRRVRDSDLDSLHPIFVQHIARVRAHADIDKQSLLAVLRDPDNITYVSTDPLAVTVFRRESNRVQILWIIPRTIPFSVTRALWIAALEDGFARFGPQLANVEIYGQFSTQDPGDVQTAQSLQLAFRPDVGVRTLDERHFELFMPVGKLAEHLGVSVG